MNNDIKQIILFIFYFLLQVFVLNNVNLFGYVNPFLYIMFILFYPFKSNRFPVLTLAFLLGILIDFFTDSGGVNAFASLIIAYIRPFFLKRIFQKDEEENNLLNPNEETFQNVFLYATILTLIHHFSFFSLLNFSFDNFIKNVVLNTISSSIFTLTLYSLGSFIFRSNKNNET